MFFSKRSRNYSVGVGDIKYNSNNLLKYDTQLFKTEYKRMKIHSRIKQNRTLQNFHKTLIKKKFNSFTLPKLNLDLEENLHTLTTSDFFITKTENEKKYFQTTTNFTDKTNKEKSKINNLKQISIPKLKIIESYSYKKPLTFNRIFSDCLKNGGGNKFNHKSISQFTDRTRVIRKGNINKETLSTRLKIFMENQELDIQNIERKIFIINNTKIKLDLYIDFLGQYVLYLYGIINKEKIILNELYSKKSELQLNIIGIDNKIKKNKLLLELYKQYKIFLLLVKYKQTKMLDIPETELKKYGIEIERQDSHSSIRYSRINTKRSSYNSRNSFSLKRGSIFDQRKLIQKFTTKNISPKRSIMRRKSKFDTNGFIFGSQNNLSNALYNIPIFESVDEFIDKLSYLDNKVRELFSIFSDYQCDNVQLILKAKELENCKEKEKEELNKKIINNTIIELNRLKEHNLILQNKYNEILQSYNQSFTDKVYSKIKKILIDIPINIEIDFDIVNFYTKINNADSKSENIMIKGNKYNKFIFCLNILERIMLHYNSLIRKITFMNPQKQHLCDKIFEELQKKKRLENNKRRLINQRKRLEIINNKALERNKKIVIPMKRKIDIYETLLSRQKKEREEELKRLKNKNKDITSAYENWIVY